MKEQPHRLQSSNDHQFSGSAIDRSKPLLFQVNGRTVSGFRGDTVLSALIASGVDTVGERKGQPIALSSRYAPAVVPAALAGDAQQALPMDRLPATDGTDYVTFNHAAMRGGLRRLLRPRRSLGEDLSSPHSMQLPWLLGTPEPAQAVDVLVVGGGVAGLTAALHAAEAGLSVTLIESTPHLGGQARLFGRQEGEETPDEAIARLARAIAASSITVMTCAQAIAARPGKVRIHAVDRDHPQARLIDIEARHTILATGTVERLPIFSGNRLPGVSTASDAFDLASRYGVWPGETTVIASTSSPAYRLATLAANAGPKVLRIMDGRAQPQSRFIEFCKAYGITLAAGTIISAVKTMRRFGLTVTPQLSLDGYIKPEPEFAADRVIVSGGWQPELTLWHMAGGESRWREGSHRLEPSRAPAGVALAGSAAGFRSLSGCLASGVAAVDHLLGRSGDTVTEHTIDPAYETPDGATPIAALSEGDTEPVYLDGGRRLLERPRFHQSRWPKWLPRGKRTDGWVLSNNPQPLDVADVAAGVQLGTIPAASAGIVARERVAMIALAPRQSTTPPPTPNPPLVPPFLSDRYGSDARLWLLVADDGRRFEAGSLIYHNSDVAGPLNAIGVVVRTTERGTIALISGTLVEPQAVAVRDQSRAVAARLIGPFVD